MTVYTDLFNEAIDDLIVTLATTMYAGALYRQRGAVDQFASFDGMGTVPTTGLSPIIKQLAGIPRPQVA